MSLESDDSPRSDSEHAVTVSSGDVPGPPPREAIVYIGPLKFDEHSPNTVVGITTRLAAACESQSATGTSTWSVEWRSGAIEKDESTPQVDFIATIFRQDGDNKLPMFDVFEYSWSDYVRENWVRQSRRSRFARLLFTVRGIPTFLRMFGSPSARRMERGRMQLALAIVLAFVFLMYTALVLVATVQAVRQGVQVLQGNGAAAAMITWPQWVVIVATFLGFSVDKEKDRVARLGAGLATAHTYLRGTTGQADRLRAPLQSKLEEIRADDNYSSATLIAYSFGAIIAIDNLFPPAGPPSRSYEKVKKLVTIGAAYDFVFAANKHYLENRKADPAIPEQWINIYASADLLGSDFHTKGRKKGDDYVTVATDTSGRSVEPDEDYEYNTGMRLTWWNVIEFYGFNAHQSYWGSDTDEDTNVFTWAIKRLYPEDDGPLR